MDGEVVRGETADLSMDAASTVSFDGFYRREYEVTLAVVLALRGNRVSAEEVTQEAFLRVYRDWSRVGAMDRPEHWVRRVAVNLATSRWRRLAAEARAVARLQRHGTEPRLSDTERVEAAARFWWAVRRLPAGQAQVVALRYVADLTVDEIAGVIDRPPGTVKSRLHLARQRLAGLLTTDEEDGR